MKLFFNVIRLVTLSFLLALGGNTLAIAKDNRLVEQVSIEDFSIGKSGSLSSLRIEQVNSVAPNQTVVRELASLAGGESGLSVPSRGYLSDIVWTEKSYNSLSGHTSSRIIYYGFNVGRWKRQLTSETTVLFRSFITQPTLVFLADDDKVAVAERMLKSDLFAQAVTQQEQSAGDSVMSHRQRKLNDFYEALGDEAVSALTEDQIDASTEKLSNKLSASIARPPLLAAAFQYTDTLDFSDPSKAFPIYYGMDVAGKRNINNEEILEYSSQSSLAYGMQPLADFDDESGDWRTRLDRHFLQVPMVSPVNGFLSKDVVKQTNIKLSKYPELEATGGSSQLAVFRNNPNTAFDGPMAVNIATTAAVLIESVGTSVTFFTPSNMKKSVEKVSQFIENAEPYIEMAALVYVLAESSQLLLCEAVDQNEGVCGDFSEQLSQLKRLIPSGIMAGMTATLKAEESHTTLDPDTFCGQIITDGIFSGNVRKSDVLSNKNSKRTRLLMCGFDIGVTKPLIDLVKNHFPAKYKNIEDLKSIQLTADFLKRRSGINIKIPFNYRIKSSQRLEAQVALFHASKKSFDLSQAMFEGVELVLDVSNATLEFVSEALAGKIKMKSMMTNLRDVILDEFEEQGNQLAANATYDIFVGVTPAKYVQMAKTLGNKGGNLGWAWLTSPAVIKLNLRRTSQDELSINDRVPPMAAVRYLKVPEQNSGLIHDTLSGKHTLSDEQALVLPLAADSAANNLLVLNPFKTGISNQTAFEIGDKTSVKQLIRYGGVRFLYNVKRLVNSSVDTKVPLASRSVGDFFHVDVTVLNKWIPFIDSIVSLDSNLWINRKIFGSVINDYQAVDFREIYKKQLGGGADPYPLLFYTPGIFSVYTHFKYTSGKEEKLYSNQVNIYVLRGMTEWADRLIASSKRYQMKQGGQFGGIGEVQLQFDQSNWDAFGKHGMWAIWKTTVDGSTVWSSPVSLGAIRGGDLKVLAYPADIEVSNTELIVYGDILHGYMSNTGASKVGVLNQIGTYAADNPDTDLPIIWIPLKRLAAASGSLLAAADSDDDRTPDYLDDFPNDNRYQYDTDGDGMADSWEEAYGFRVQKKWDADLDTDEDGHTNLEEFLWDADPTDPSSYSSTPVPTLNDTGIIQCADGTTNDLSCPVSGYPDQDAQYGRDINNNDDSDGHAGFSFTKLDTNGNELLANATEWSCVKDNVTGLIWEAKQGGNGTMGDEGLHDADDNYSWYTTDARNDGGSAGYQNDDGAICYGYDVANASSYCNTQAFATRVNTQGLCGASDWRLPTREALRSLVSYDIAYPGPSIETEYFSNTVGSGYYWSSSPYAFGSSEAWVVVFNGDDDNTYAKYQSVRVRLVRGGQ